MVSLSAVQFSNGFRLDLEQVGNLCRSRGTLLNLDAIQYLGALHLDLTRVHIDFLSAGGHKWLLGPIGTGIFYCRRESMPHLSPPNVGYHSVEKPDDHLDYELRFRPDAGRFEEALVNFPGIWGLEAAVNVHLDLGPERVEAYILGLNSLARKGLEAKGYQIVSPQGDKEVSGILSFRHPRLPSQEVYGRLRTRNVTSSLTAGALRMSPSVYNDEDEIGRFLEALP